MTPEYVTKTEAKERLQTKLAGVYALVDPSAHTVVRYVGSSVHVYRRFLEHSQPSKIRSLKNDWVAALRANGLLPVMQILELADPGTSSYEMHEAERKWIMHFTEKGFADLNATMNATEYDHLRGRIDRLNSENKRLREELAALRLRRVAA